MIDQPKIGKKWKYQPANILNFTAQLFYCTNSIFLYFFRRFDTLSLNRTGSNLRLLFSNGMFPNPEKKIFMQVCFWEKFLDFFSKLSWLSLMILLCVTFIGGCLMIWATRKLMRMCSQSGKDRMAVVRLTDRFSMSSFGYFLWMKAALVSTMLYSLDRTEL